MGITEIWTLVALILHFCGVGAFAEWPAIAGPFTWSCCTLEIWVFMFYGALLAFCLFAALFGSKK